MTSPQYKEALDGGILGKQTDTEPHNQTALRSLVDAEEKKETKVKTKKTKKTEEALVVEPEVEDTKEVTND